MRSPPNYFELVVIVVDVVFVVVDVVIAVVFVLDA